MAPSLLQSAVAGGAAVISLTAAAYFYRRSLCSGGRRRAVGIIPARFQSSRFEGKPLAHILGKPMIQRTWEQAVQATALEAWWQQMMRELQTVVVDLVPRLL